MGGVPSDTPHAMALTVDATVGVINDVRCTTLPAKSTSLTIKSEKRCLRMPLKPGAAVTKLTPQEESASSTETAHNPAPSSRHGRHTGRRETSRRHACTAHPTYCVMPTVTSFTELASGGGCATLP